MIMFQMLLGHLVGDYLLQNEWMAMNKTKNSYEGWSAALIHCILYTLAVCTLMWKFDNLWVIIVFLSHFPIDKFGLAEKYMHYIKGKGLKDFVNKNKWKNQLVYVPVQKNEISHYDLLEGGFTAVVYAITDNTLHLVLMYTAYIMLY